MDTTASKNSNVCVGDEVIITAIKSNNHHIQAKAMQSKAYSIPQ